MTGTPQSPVAGVVENRFGNNVGHEAASPTRDAAVTQVFVTATRGHRRVSRVKFIAKWAIFGDLTDDVRFLPPYSVPAHTVCPRDGGLLRR
jgi:hypothetical protein